AAFGYPLAFVFNALSFVFSAACISRLRMDAGFRPPRKDVSEDNTLRPWHEYVAGIRYMRTTRLVLAIGLISVGWATGGGAAQILFSLFGENVFNAGPLGIGVIWGFAGIGLLIGGTIGYWLGKRLSSVEYKRTIAIVYLVHGTA